MWSHLSSDSWVTKVTSVSKPLRLGFQSCSSLSCGRAAIVSSEQPPCCTPNHASCAVYVTVLVEEVSCDAWQMALGANAIEGNAS